MLEVLKYIFSGFWIFIGTCILLNIILNVTIVNIFKIINNYFEYRCIAKLSNDGKTTEEIDKIFNSTKKEKSSDSNDTEN
jgi:hypothetical protein